MRGASVKIDFGDPDVRDALTKPLRQARQLVDALPDIGEELLQSTDERFRREQGPDGAPWAPLKPATLKQKKRKRRPFILQEEGLRGGLRGSINYRIQGAQLSLGSPLPYARIHQEGGQAGKGGAATIPARPYLGVSDDDQAAINDIIRDHLGLDG